MLAVKDIHPAAVDFYEDPGFSAKSLQRPEMTRLLAAVRAGTIGCVMIAKLDRITRSVLALGVLLALLAKHDCALVSVSESLDTQSATGQLQLNILVAISQWERGIISERTIDALAEKKARGERIGTPSYGFAATADGKLAPHAREQSCLSLMRTLRAEGLSYQKVADGVNAAGFRTRGGRAFLRSGIVSTLQNAA